MSDCRDWTRIANPGQSVGWRCNTHGDGPYVGDSSPYLCRVGRAAETERILQDLIVELRNISSGWEYKASSIMSLDNAAYQIQPLLDRAEKQLKELTNE